MSAQYRLESTFFGKEPVAEPWISAHSCQSRLPTNMSERRQGASESDILSFLGRKYSSDG